MNEKVLPETNGSVDPNYKKLFQVVDIGINFFKELQHENAWAVYLLLLKNGTMKFGDIRRHIGKSQPAVSYHIKSLWSLGLITRKREGKHWHYSIADVDSETKRCADAIIRILNGNHNVDIHALKLPPLNDDPNDDLLNDDAAEKTDELETIYEQIDAIVPERFKSDWYANWDGEYVIGLLQDGQTARECIDMYARILGHRWGIDLQQNNLNGHSVNTASKK